MGVLGLGAVEASINGADFALLDFDTLRPNPPAQFSSASSGSPQPYVHRSLSITPSTNEVISVAPSFEATSEADLRPFLSREHFMRRCFESLLAFAFPHNDSSPSPMASKTSTSSRSSVKLSFGSGKPHVMLCRTAIRDVIDRCRFILQRFTKCAQLTGKCPLPR